jgi:hypothetical protein
MDAVAQAHLDKAGAYRTVVHTLAALPQAAANQPPLLDWAVVAAFYAAVHYINAFLLETTGQAPTAHGPRRSAMIGTKGARALAAYRGLEDLAWQIRYEPRFVLDPQDADHAIRSALETVRRVVRSGLGLPGS